MMFDFILDKKLCEAARRARAGEEVVVEVVDADSAVAKLNTMCGEDDLRRITLLVVDRV
jgi:hypothetical protein